MAGTDDQTGGGFARGFIYGMLLAIAAFVAYAVLNPLSPDKMNTTGSETQSLQQPQDEKPEQATRVVEPEEPLENNKEQEQEQETARVETSEQTTQANASTPAGPQFGAPVVDEESGVSGRTEAPPTLGSPGSQVAIVRPASPGAPVIGTDAPSTPIVTDTLVPVSPDNLIGLDMSELLPGNALTENAVPVSGDDGRPYFAIILQDVEGQGVAREGLTALRAAISFGVKVDSPQAGAISQLYSDAGFEVVAILPERIAQLEQSDATSQSVVSTLAGFIDSVPNATAIIDQPASSFAQDPAFEFALLSGLGVTGHGLLSQGSDGQSISARAAEAGFPAAEIFREIDERPEPENVILALERAVAEAREKGAVIVIGQTRPETITTLFAWLLGPGSSSVKIVPASAAIKRLSE